MQFSAVILAAATMTTSNAYIVVGISGSAGTGPATFTLDTKVPKECTTINSTGNFVIQSQDEDYKKYGRVIVRGFPDTRCASAGERVDLYDPSTISLYGRGPWRSYNVTLLPKD